MRPGRTVAASPIACTRLHRSRIRRAMSVFLHGLARLHTATRHLQYHFRTMGDWILDRRRFNLLLKTMRRRITKRRCHRYQRQYVYRRGVRGRCGRFQRDAVFAVHLGDSSSRRIESCSGGVSGWFSQEYLSSSHVGIESVWWTNYLNVEDKRME